MIDDVPYQEGYFECKIIDSNKKVLLYINNFQWKYIQDKPDLFLNSKDITEREEIELEERRCLNETKISHKIRSNKIISRTRLSISEIWKLFEFRYRTVTIQNVENLDIIQIKNGMIESDKYQFEDQKRVWINIDISIYYD